MRLLKHCLLNYIGFCTVYAVSVYCTAQIEQFYFLNFDNQRFFLKTKVTSFSKMKKIKILTRLIKN